MSDVIRDIETLDAAFTGVAPYVSHRIAAIKAIRAVTRLSLRETLIVIANTFGFYADNVDDLTGWREFMRWQDFNQISLESVQGPYAMTMLKAIAAKHGRGVSTEQ